MGLNPCFSGTYSQSNVSLNAKQKYLGLNPCFSGTYSQRVTNTSKDVPFLVLILVLVEHTLRVLYEERHYHVCSLNPCFSGTYSQSNVSLNAKQKYLGLNPCFSGTYSQRVTNTSKDVPFLVLILVLVEHTLRVLYEERHYHVCSLNPCFSGTYSQSCGCCS